MPGARRTHTDIIGIDLGTTNSCAFGIIGLAYLAGFLTYDHDHGDHLQDTHSCIEDSPNSVGILPVGGKAGFDRGCSHRSPANSLPVAAHSRLSRSSKCIFDRAGYRRLAQTFRRKRVLASTALSLWCSARFRTGWSLFVSGAGNTRVLVLFVAGAALWTYEGEAWQRSSEIGRTDGPVCWKIRPPHGAQDLTVRDSEQPSAYQVHHPTGRILKLRLQEMSLPIQML